MTFLIVDDETPAREELKFILKNLDSSLELLEAKDGKSALDYLDIEQIDVIFLDINMPGKNGLQLADEVLRGEDGPLVIFATAYDEHAVKAFELAATDYLLKPFDEARIEASLDRIKEHLKNQKRASSRAARPLVLDKLWVEQENENRFLLDFADIYWFSTEDKRTFAHSLKGRYLVRYSLKELEAQLASHGFVRAHKTHLVNLHHIAELVPWLSGNYLVRMNDASRTELTLSRRYAAQLKERTHWR